MASGGLNPSTAFGAPSGVRSGLPRSRALVVVAGIVVAVIGFAATFAAAQLFRPSATGTTQIVVAARDVPARATLAAGDLTLAPYQAATLPAASFRETAQVTGKATVVAIRKGQPVLGTWLVASPDELPAETPPYLPLASGFVAVTLPTGEQQGVGGYIQTGDYITVIATVNLTLFRADLNRSVTKTTLTNLHVIRAGPLAAQTGQRVTSASSLTVAVTQCDAEYLTWLLNNASLRYTLEAYHDYQPQDLVADPSCKSVSQAGGVSAGQVDARFAFTKV